MGHCPATDRPLSRKGADCAWENKVKHHRLRRHESARPMSESRVCGFYRGYMGIMEKKMETIILGLYRVLGV